MENILSCSSVFWARYLANSLVPCQVNNHRNSWLHLQFQISYGGKLLKTLIRIFCVGCGLFFKAPQQWTDDSAILKLEAMFAWPRMHKELVSIMCLFYSFQPLISSRNLGKMTIPKNHESGCLLGQKGTVKKIVNLYLSKAFLHPDKINIKYLTDCQCNFKVYLHRSKAYCIQWVLLWHICIGFTVMFSY